MAQVLRPLIEKFRPQDHPNLLAGVTDDAAVYKLDNETAVVMTLDFFPPVVGDPWTYGAIAAANAMSDVYAMGAEVVLCLNIAGFPDGMDPSILTSVFTGGADKVAEAGGIIAGGHTVIDAEPKYGLSIMGICRPDALITKTGARPGDVLILTKALGTGLILTASKRDLVSPDHLQEAVDSMLLLNRHASHVAKEAGAHALTDVTGFGIIGHALEIADHSGVQLELSFAALPLLTGALGYATAGVDFGGVNRNRNQLGPRATVDESLDEIAHRLLFDPQTSGGLLMAVEPALVETTLEHLRQSGRATVIGRVLEGSGLRVIP